MKGGSTITKVWCVKNNGDETWPEGTTLQFCEGEVVPNDPSMASSKLSNLAQPNQILEVSVLCLVPDKPGAYRGVYRLSYNNVLFGDKVVVCVVVPPPSPPVPVFQTATFTPSTPITSTTSTTTPAISAPVVADSKVTPLNNPSPPSYEQKVATFSPPKQSQPQYEGRFAKEIEAVRSMGFDKPISQLVRLFEAAQKDNRGKKNIVDWVVHKLINSN